MKTLITRTHTGRDGNARKVLRSFTAMKSNIGDQDPRTKEGLRRLITLYKSWGRTEEAARYRSLLSHSRS